MGGRQRPLFGLIVTLFTTTPFMEDNLWTEIMEAPGEIWDIPEMQDDDEDEQSWNQFVNGNVTL